MHRFGGMYADLDMEALRDMTPLLSGSTEPVLAYLSDTWSLRHNIPNAWMASPPGHPFWQVRALESLIEGDSVDEGMNRCIFAASLSPVQLGDSQNIWLPWLRT